MRDYALSQPKANTGGAAGDQNLVIGKIHVYFGLYPSDAALLINSLALTVSPFDLNICPA